MNMMKMSNEALYVYPQEFIRVCTLDRIDLQIKQNGAFTFEIDLFLIFITSTSNPNVYGTKDNI